MNKSLENLNLQALRVSGSVFIFALLGLLFAGCGSVAPTPTPTSGEPYSSVEVDNIPIPDRENLAYRKVLREKGVYGTILTKITVGTDGRVSDIAIIRGDNDTMAAELPALVRNWKFTPASKDGRPVACYVLMQCKSAPANAK